jgi:hypothetical protein
MFNLIEQQRSRIENAIKIAEDFKAGNFEPLPKLTISEDDLATEVQKLEDEFNALNKEVQAKLLIKICAYLQKVNKHMDDESRPAQQKHASIAYTTKIDFVAHCPSFSAHVQNFTMDSKHWNRRYRREYYHSITWICIAGR